ncbi:SOS response-associated peptidase family protein [Pelomonas sp. SE-A7]|uniref:SOS response-associated peptidase family protein n=1 Tax=Pelomonas sp. SE-A7 TaxID=3054953 RepID=UPI00259CE73C|nr:SOS response-associated peptidase family protein [Pelomonas sp. SE-A7]MDM4765984.1 SOS response-associated peptidase family protein [Pelomonas sp. SE-A7]
MCYSAQVWADYRTYVRDFGAEIDIKEFYETFFRRAQGDAVTMPRAMESAFDNPQTDVERTVKQLIDEFRQVEHKRLQEEVFAQRTRLADAERKLSAKETKAALESKRIATTKVDRALAKLKNLDRTDLRESDFRMFPKHYVPVMVFEEGRLVVRPMRYQCRPVGKPEFYDTKYPGTFNARRDNLEGFWKGQFGRTHGVALVSAFYENVPRHKAEHRELREGEAEENVILEFRPRPAHDMVVACLYSHWTAPGQPGMWSFAFITDEPPAEVADAGHDRCIVPLKPENMLPWLQPDAKDLKSLYALLDDRDTPYYEHQLAA